MGYAFALFLWFAGLGAVFGYFNHDDYDTDPTFTAVAAWIWMIFNGGCVVGLIWSAIVSSTPKARDARLREQQEAEQRRLAEAEQYRLRLEEDERLAREREERRVQLLTEMRERQALHKTRAAQVRQELRADRSVAFRVFRRDGYACVRCGTDGTEPGNDLTVDHIHPVAHGGNNDIGNLQTLCRRCNSRKGTSR